MDRWQPRPEDRFSFGLWTVGNRGRDPFGEAVRERLAPQHIVQQLAACGAYGVSLHDNDLVPVGARARQRDQIVRDFQAALSDHGLVVPMATVNLFSLPVFKDGAFTSNEPAVRAFALQKSLAAIDLAVELGAETFVLWGGREGVETDFCRDPREALRRIRHALDFLCEYVREQQYSLRFALEAKPNEPRGDLYLATTGHMLHFIETLARLSMVHAVAQAMECGKLFHIDLNAQRGGRYDQDLRFASEDLKQAFLLVRLLEGTAGGERYVGPRHFDAHAYRSEDEEGVWDFARGCMRSYKILAARAAEFDADPEVQGLLMQPAVGEWEWLLAGYSPAAVQQLRGLEIDGAELARRGLQYERLDQLAHEHLLGAR
jgi:xylose isomerase